MAGSIQQQPQDKGREIQERLAVVAATLRRNVQEGIRSAVAGDGRTLGRPPSGQSAGRRRSDDRRVPTRAQPARRRRRD
jgi:hypothetical protein